MRKPSANVVEPNMCSAKPGEENVEANTHIVEIHTI